MKAGVGMLSTRCPFMVAEVPYGGCKDHLSLGVFWLFHAVRQTCPLLGMGAYMHACMRIILKLLCTNLYVCVPRCRVRLRQQQQQQPPQQQPRPTSHDPRDHDPCDHDPRDRDPRPATTTTVTAIATATIAAAAAALALTTTNNNSVR